MEIRLKKRTLEFLTLLYLYVPFALFMLAWTKLYFAIPSILAAGLGIFLFVRRAKEKADDFVRMKPVVFVVSIILLLAVGFLAGLGGYFEQAYDWEKHNAVLCDLVNMDWPVCYDTGSEKALLSYYIGAYIPAALIGKLLSSITAAKIALGVWLEMGLILVFFNLVRILKVKKVFMQIVTLLVYITFTLPTPVFELCAFVFLRDFPEMARVHTDNLKIIQYTLPSSIAVYQSILFLWDNRDDLRDYLLFLFPAVFYNPLGAVGIFIFEAVYAVYLFTKRKIKNIRIFRELFSGENLLSLFIVFPIPLLYYCTNILQEKPDDSAFALTDFSGGLWLVYLVYFVIVILVPFLLLRKRHLRDPYFLIPFGILTASLFFEMGFQNDLLLKVPLAGIFVIMMYLILDFGHIIEYDPFIRSLSDKKALSMKKEITLKEIGPAILLAVLSLWILLGVFGAGDELSGQFSTFDPSGNADVTGAVEGNGRPPIKSLSEWVDRDDDTLSSDKVYNYFIYDYESSIFFRYCIRK